MMVRAELACGWLEKFALSFSIVSYRKSSGQFELLQTSRVFEFGQKTYYSNLDILRFR